MENPTTSLERILAEDIGSAMKIAIAAFSTKVNARSDRTFYETFGEAFYGIIKNRGVYKKIDSEGLNSIIQNTQKLFKSAESVVLADPRSHSTLEAMTLNKSHTYDGILNDLPAFPPSCEKDYTSLPYLSLRDYTLGALMAASDETKFELEGINYVLELYNTIPFIETYVGKRIDLTVHKNDGTTEYFSDNRLSYKKDLSL